MKSLTHEMTKPEFKSYLYNRKIVKLSHHFMRIPTQIVLNSRSNNSDGNNVYYKALSLFMQQVSRTHVHTRIILDLSVEKKAGLYNCRWYHNPNKY